MWELRFPPTPPPPVLTMFFFVICSIKHLKPPTSLQNFFYCMRLHYFTIGFKNKFESLYTSHFCLQSVFFSISQIKYVTLIRITDYCCCPQVISLKPWPSHNFKQLDHDKWNMFKHREQHIIHLNIKSLLPKIDELRHIAKVTNEVVIRVSESKLGNSVLTPEF